MISDGDFGSVKMIHSAYYTDFMYRPRRPEELESQTGGVLFSQGAHQFDIARFLAGGEAESIIGTTFIYDPKRRASGAYTCQIRFSNKATASLVYSGYDHFLSDMEVGGISELGSKVAKISGAARSKIRGLTPEEEMSLKKDRGYNADQNLPMTDSNEHFGRWVVSLEKADMIIEPEHIDLYTDNGKSRIDIPVQVGTRQNVCQSMVDLVLHDIKPVQTASWGRATLECCLALLESNETGTTLKLQKQVPARQFPEKNDSRNLS
ncbi:Gfo/Idh/MocA family oxidoreductase [Alphaproteobacteria bacterium]|nr:Gfo/Idh/MocA family oxidoreductase [Alphaproteobacteria bacterium]